jgi:hypothetical protein
MRDQCGHDVRHLSHTVSRNATSGSRGSNVARTASLPHRDRICSAQSQSVRCSACLPARLAACACPDSDVTYRHRACRASTCRV